jgi:protein-disulfide isomerase
MSTLKPPVSDKDQSTANTSSHTVLVEYGDYQCPHCGHAHPLVKKLLKEKGDAFRFVFRNFPLQEAHPAAFMAAVSAEAAGKQGKFWEMHDMIFEHQQRLTAGFNALLDFAEALNLNIQQFAADVKSDEIVKKVEDDFESGIRSGVNGTPTFFINGARADYDGSYESLLSSIA